MQQSPMPPKMATKLLDIFVPSELREVLIGDLNEEFVRRTKQQNNDASAWFWKQSLMTSGHFFSDFLSSENFLRKLILVVTAILLPTLLMAVFWLSNVDESSEYIWNNLLDGKVHLIVLTSEFWEVGSQTVLRQAGLSDIEIYIHFPSAIWALTAFVVLYIRNKCEKFTAHQATAWGATLMFLPYVFGLVFIELSNPVAKQVGPIIALMTISMIYIILPLAWFVLNKAGQQTDC